MKRNDDEYLVKRCLDGDRDVFGEILDRYEKRVFNIALRIVHDTEDARDVAQTVFVNVFTHLRQFDPNYNFHSWVYRIAVNESLKFLGRKSRHPSDEYRDEATPGTSDPGRSLDATETSRTIQRCLMRLTPDYRVAIVLRHFVDCSYREMSQILGIPEKTVKSRLFSARKRMRDDLVGDGSDRGRAEDEARVRRPAPAPRRRMPGR